MEGSVLDAPLVDELVRGVDRVFHLAAVVGVRLVVSEPARTMETNVGGTRHVLAAVERHGARCLVVSSSEVYGRSPKLPFREDDPPLLGTTREPRWSYALSKACGEGLALALAEERGLETVVVRLFNTVGPRQRGRYGMVLPRFVRQALEGVPLTVYGDGRQTRCFTHVRDTVQALLSLMGARGATGRVFNVGSEHEVSIGELASRVQRAAESGSPIVHVPLEEVYGRSIPDPQRRVPDVERLAKVTGFRASTSLDEIVADAVDYARSRTAIAS